MSDDPVRLKDASGSPALRSALEAARADVPSPEALQALATRLGPLTAPLAPAAPAAVAGGGAAVAIGAGIVGAAIVAIGAVWWMTPAPEQPPPPPAVVDVQPDVPTPAPPPEAPPAVPVPVPAPAPRVVQPAVVTPSGAAPVADDLDAELALVGDAQLALRTDAALALALAEQHAGRFPQGTLAQEREVVAIEALTALGRLDEARTRTEAFLARWPDSAHRRRLEGEK